MKRVAAILFGIAVLSAWGMPFHPPCCGFRESVRTTVESNCCPIQGCPLAQARGAAPASIAKADSLEAAPLISPASAVARIPRRDPSSSSTLVDSCSSPPRARPTAAFLSVFRV
jgi:hypothetical protein